jgi:hypothetical protein
MAALGAGQGVGCWHVAVATYSSLCGVVPLAPRIGQVLRRGGVLMQRQRCGDAASEVMYMQRQLLL